MNEVIIKNLDLTQYLERFNSLLARQKPLFISGDSNLHFERICELSEFEIKAPKETANLDDALVRLSKQAILHISEINEFAKIITYFNYLKGINFPKKLYDWLSKIEIPSTMLELSFSFDEKGELKDSVDERLGELKHKIN